MFQINPITHASNSRLYRLIFNLLNSYRVMLALIMLALIGYSTPSWALLSDRNQPINIIADQVEVNEKTEISRYTGRVHLKQGTLNISADKVTVYLRDGTLTKIIIDGRPATFEQQPEDNQELVKSCAKHMEYFAAKELLILENDAHVIQGANNFSGDFIEYDTLNSIVKANVDKNSNSRVSVVIVPKGTTPNDGSSLSQLVEAPQAFVNPCPSAKRSAK